MKKFRKTILIFCVMYIVSQAGAVFSAAGSGPSVSVTAESVEPGGYFTVSVGYDCDVAVTGTEIDIEFDTGLTFLNRTSKKEYVCDTIDYSGNTVRLFQSEGYEIDGGWTAAGKVASLDFTVDKSAKAGKKLGIRVTLKSFSDGDFNQYPTQKHPYEPVTKEIFVKVAGKIKGDLTGDGEITADDLTALARHIAKIETLPKEMWQYADVDGNGYTDAADLTVLARYIARIIDELP